MNIPTDGDQTVATRLAQLAEMAGAFLGVLGVILIAFGNYPLGIKCLVAGIALFGISTGMASAGGDSPVQKFLRENEKILVESAFLLLILGIIILACAGVAGIKIGVALIIAGAGILVAEVSKNDGSVKEKIVTFLKDNASTILGMSVVFIIFGVLCCMSGVLTWGIPFIIAGAAGIVSEVVVNWSTIKTAIGNFFKENAALVVGVSLALLVLGIILLFTGVGIPLGIGLIIAGAAGIATEVALNWDFIVDKVKSIWEKIKAFWNEHIAPIFTKEWWLNLAKKAANGLIDGFERGINGIITMFETMINWVVEKLNSLSFDIPDWVPVIGGGKFGFNLQKVKFGRVSLPRLATGGIVPRATLAEIGEAGREAVLPLESNTEWMDMLADRIAQRGGGDTTVILMLDDAELGRAVIKAGNRESRRIGTKLVVTG